MACLSTKDEMMISPLYTGHKADLAAFIRNIAPAHDVWCEPYFRMGEVFFKKQPSKKEIINDKDNNIVNFYLMIRNRWEQLYFLMESTLHCDFFSRMADNILKDEKADELYRAWAFWLKCNKVFVAPERWVINDVLSDKPAVDPIQKIAIETLAGRLANTYISCRDSLEVIREADGENTLFYLNPHTKKELVQLKPLLKDMKGRFILHTSENNLMKRWIDKIGLYTDNDCLAFGVYTNFKRQRLLFE